MEVSGNLGKTGDKLEIKEVLLREASGKITLGTPLVDGARVATEVVSAGKGEKIRVAKFKAKSRYRKVMGFRPLITTLKVISLGDEKVPSDSGKQPGPSKRRTKKPAGV